MGGIALYFICHYSPNSELGKKGAQMLILLASTTLTWQSLNTKESLYLPDILKQQGAQSTHLLDNLKHEGEKSTEDLLTVL